MTKAKWTHRNLLTQVWGIHFNIWASEMHGHNIRGTQQDLWWGDYDNITKRLQEMCLFIYAEYEEYSGIWNDLNNSTLLGMDNCPNTPTAAYDVLWHYKKPAPPCQAHIPPGGWRFSIVTMQTAARQSQETMGDHFRISRATAVRKWDTMWETSRNQQITLSHGQNHYRSDSPWHKQQHPSQQLTSYFLIRSCFTHAQPSAPPGIETSFKISTPVMQAKNSGHIQTEDIRITVTPQRWRYYHLKCFTKKRPLQIHYNFLQWRASSGSPLIQT